MLGPPLVGQIANPMSLTLPELGNVHWPLGRTPWSERVPLDPLLAELAPCNPREADRGGRPQTRGAEHNLCLRRRRRIDVESTPS
jgi:hypothetical protein